MNYADMIASEVFELVEDTKFNKALRGVKDTYRVKDGYKVSLINSTLHRLFGNARIAYIDKMDDSTGFFISFSDSRIGSMQYSVNEDLELIASRVIEVEVDPMTGEEVVK